jgi:hypothetical protein
MVVTQSVVITNQLSLAFLLTYSYMICTPNTRLLAVPSFLMIESGETAP